MFVRYYVELPFAIGAVEGAIERAPVSWMPIVAHEAESRGTDLLTEIGFGCDQARVSKARPSRSNPMALTGAKAVAVPQRYTAGRLAA